MNNAARLAIFQAQVQNVRSLGSARKHVRRAINSALRNNDDKMAGVHTKVLAQLFCAWAEANFSKVVHTPHGFTLNEIRQIRVEWRDRGITEGWKSCVDLGLSKIPTRGEGLILDARRRLKKIIKEYVSEPSLIRNRLAHGQWVVALNSKSTNINRALTQELQSLNVVQVEIWFECHTKLAQVVEELIESPRNAFARNHITQLDNLDAFVVTSRSWSLDEKMKRLKMKPARHPARMQMKDREEGIQ